MRVHGNPQIFNKHINDKVAYLVYIGVDIDSIVIFKINVVPP